MGLAWWAGLITGWVVVGIVTGPLKAGLGGLLAGAASSKQSTVIDYDGIKWRYNYG
jgi:hypothetical protein